MCFYCWAHGVPTIDLSFSGSQLGALNINSNLFLYSNALCSDLPVYALPSCSSRIFDNVNTCVLPFFCRPHFSLRSQRYLQPSAFPLWSHSAIPSEATATTLVSLATSTISRPTNARRVQQGPIFLPPCPPAPLPSFAAYLYSFLDPCCFRQLRMQPPRLLALYICRSIVHPETSSTLTRRISTKRFSESCTECPEGKIASSSGSTQCDDCMIGKYMSGTGGTTCTDW